MINQAIFNRTPLAPNLFAPLPVGAVRPLGYLLDTERVLAGSITGNLPKVWDSMRDNAWMGGQGEKWERGPYYLDGLIPLAWQLGDEELKATAMKFVEWTLSSQREDGFFGPEDEEDWWPRMVMLKALQQYFTATGDGRVLRFMSRYFVYMLRHLDEKPLGLWAIARAGENIQVVQWLYNITGQKALLRLCDKLLEQSIDWTGYFHTFPDGRDQKRAFPWKLLQPMLEGNDDPWSPAWQQHQHTHVVNLAMALKTPMLDFALHGGKKQADAFRVGWERLQKAHGLALGMFSGDEHLSGANPSQGTETCAVVEMLYTLESLMALSDDASLGDLWERLAYNALPACLSADGWTHQYNQQVNQIRVDSRERDWYNTNRDANVFGLEPNFGCCTANLHQGWPKFTAHLWMASRDGGLAAQSYAPCRVTWEIGGAKVRLEVEGSYPAGEQVRILLHASAPADFPIRLRIPAWAQGAHAEIGEESYTGEAGSYLLIRRTWADGDEIRLTLPMSVRTESRYHRSVSVVRGPLLYALPIPARWSYRGELPLCDRWAEPVGKWNYALLPEEGFSVNEAGTQIRAAAFVCGDWKEVHGSAGPIPVLPLREGAEKETVTLVPYATAPLRIAQFPHGRENTETTEEI